MTILIKNQTGWRRNTNLERNMTVVAGGMLLASSFLALALSTLYLNHSCNAENIPSISAEKHGLIRNSRSLFQNEKNENQIPICHTASCVNTAASIINNMDPSVDPCDDFYQFACGNFIKNTIINDGSNAVTSFSKIHEKVSNELLSLLTEPIQSDEQKPFRMMKLLFKSCMDIEKIEEKGLEPFKAILRSLGGWPVLDKEEWDDTKFTWEKSIYKSFTLAGYSNVFLITFIITSNPKNNTINSISLDEPVLGLNSQYLINGTDNKLVDAYYRYMVDIAVLFGADRQSAAKELKESLDFEISLAKISMTLAERKDSESMNNPMNIADLQQKFPSIPWQEYMNKLLSPLTIQQDDIIIVRSPKYLSNLETLLSNTPKRVQANYVFWRTTMASVDLLTKKLRLRQGKYYASLYGNSGSVPRWNECLKNVKQMFQLAIDSMYVRRVFDKNALNNVQEIVNRMKEELYKLLSSNDWMDDQTKKNAINKAKLMTYHIAYADELLDNNKLNAYYKNLEINDKDYFESSLNVTKFFTDRMIMELRQPLNNSDWTKYSQSTIINAFYNPSENSIVIPAAILQGEFLSSDRPRYLNYGAIGFVIGHEITHGFDNVGRMFDGHGNIVDWWAKETKEQFLKKAMCIIKQYGNYTDHEVGLKINGNNTQGENIADNGGIKQAYNAYITWASVQWDAEPRLPGLQNYTPNQLFWLSAANIWCSKHRPEELKNSILTNEHAPNHFRIIGSFSNQKEFSNDFQCYLGSNMNPSNKCQVW
ncbi:neprilysin-2-like [Rhopalosiphum maidis]|uniref:neprilysin-2-like n=1 Tax=Rhopalosiphum maidis TaxID=43146 RepID=UPI000EFE8435|nr:neprilysin-2-like [Rhopalosiphum maidis]